MAISEKQFQTAARVIGCAVSTVKAVSEVESGGDGLINGRPVILFEPHIFWKQLRALGVDTAKAQKGNEDILYPVWGTKPYPSGQDKKWAMLDKAINLKVDGVDPKKIREAALKSASWGRFQIMGFNFKSCGCKTVQEFVNKMYSGEDAHLEMFVAYIIDNHLDDELRAKDFKGFARGYNGELFYRNKYDTRLAAADLKYAS